MHRFRSSSSVVLFLEIGVVEERRIDHEDTQNHDDHRKHSRDAVYGMEGDWEVVIAGYEAHEIDEYLDRSCNGGHEGGKRDEQRATVRMDNL